MAKTYDEIERGTVPMPDSSWTPTREQVKQSKEGFRALDADEQALAARVHAALGSDAAGVTIEVARDSVTLRGTVKNAATMASLPDRVRGIDGVGNVIDQLSVG